MEEIYFGLKRTKRDHLFDAKIRSFRIGDRDPRPKT